VVFERGDFSPLSMYLKSMYDNILIDGRNIIYRAVAASKSSNYDTHPVTIVIRMMDKWRRLFKPNKWRVFWDVPKQAIWRHDIYKDYKGGRPSYDEEFKEYIKQSQTICSKIFYNCKITQYIKSHNEADDLIYAFIVNNQNKKNLIVSSDGDMPQITFRFENCDIHNPNYKKFDIFPIPKYDPIIIKSLTGDKSDNIKNYPLVAEKTAMKIIDKGTLDDFLKLKGIELFNLNKSLIDLSLNPNLESNIDYIKSVNDNDNFNLKNVEKLILKHSVKGLYQEFIQKINPFKNN
jgi:5'-3' exonuclease